MPDYKKGYLSDFFKGFAVKRLTAVEVDPEVSNQHEFQGIQKLKLILGTPSDKISYNSRFIWLDDSKKSDVTESFATWSDVRRGKQNRSAEYHLYYSAEAAEIVHNASPGDLLLVCKQKNDDLLIVITPTKSTVERQLAWLFDFSLEEDSKSAVAIEFGDTHDKEVGFSDRFILDQLSIETGQTDDNFLCKLLKRFGASFPTTRDFSGFARETMRDVSATDNPDDVLMIWMNHEEKLFRTLEKHIVGGKLKALFMESDLLDVDGFMDFSKSVLQRRRSRAGHALENHLEAIFEARGINYSRGKKTEDNNKPDFVFPGIEQYHCHDFPFDQLTILGVKTSCKDRWRQVLTEAARVKKKHLLTLEPAISENQTNEMKKENLQLVIPKGLHSSYTVTQQNWLIDIASFIQLVQDR